MVDASQAGSPAHLLHIEDDPCDVFLIDHALAELSTQFVVENFSRGDEAEDYLQQVAMGHKPKPDLILLDLDLPKVSGHELLRFIKRDNELGTIPVIVLTGLVYAEDLLLAGYRMSVYGVIAKPLSGADYPEVAQEIEQAYLEIQGKAQSPKSYSKTKK